MRPTARVGRWTRDICAAARPSSNRPDERYLLEGTQPTDNMETELNELNVFSTHLVFIRLQQTKPLLR